VSLLLPSSKQASANASFLPADYVIRKAEVRNNIIVLSLFALILAAVGMAFVYNTKQKMNLASEYRALKDQCENESKKIEQLKRLQEARATMLEKAEITGALVEKLPRWAVLGEVAYRLGETMKFERVEMKGTRVAGASPALPAPVVKSLTADAAAKQKATSTGAKAPSFTYDLTIAGTAEENNHVADFLASLKRSPALRDVELQYIKETRLGEETYRSFEIVARLRGEPGKQKLADSLRKLIADRTGHAEASAPPEEAAPASSNAAPATEEVQ